MYKSKTNGKSPYSKCLSSVNIKITFDRYNCLKKFLDSKVVNKWSKEVQASFYLEIGSVCGTMTYFDEALRYLLFSENLHREINSDTVENRSDEALLFYEITLMYTEIGNNILAKKYAKKTKASFEFLLDNEGLGLTYNILSIIEMREYNFDLSLDLAFKGLKIREDIKSERVKSSLNNIGEIYRVQGDFEKAIFYYKKAIEISQHDDFKINLAGTYNNIGLIKSYIGEHSSALDYFYKSNKIFEELNIYDCECKLDYVSALIMASGQNRIPSKSKDMNEETESSIISMLYDIPKHLTKTKSNRLLIQYLLTVGDYYLNQNDFRLARVFYKQCKTIADFNNYPGRQVYIRAKMIGRSLRLYKLHKLNQYMSEAKRLLEVAKKIAYDSSLKYPLVIELSFIESALLIINLETEKALEILMKIKWFATKTNNNFLKERINIELKGVKENKPGKKNPIDIDIIKYVNSIARFVRD